jgi:hypothetical protein
MKREVHKQSASVSGGCGELTSGMPLLDKIDGHRPTGASHSYG